MDAVQHHRETVQPIREKTGGSTFKNPEGTFGLEGDRQGRLPRPDDRRRADVADALQLHDQHRHRDRLRSRISRRDGAPRVFENSGIRLQWEIKRIGIFMPGREVRPFQGVTTE